MTVGRDSTGRFVSEDTRAKVATLRAAEGDLRRTVISDLDELATRVKVEQGALATQQQAAGARAMLLAAGELSEQVRVDLREITLNLESQLQELGEHVQDSAKFQGVMERTQAALGALGWTSMRNRAELRRVSRLESMPMKDSLRLIGKLVEETVVELGKIEEQLIEDVEGEGGYVETIKMVIEKLNQRQPEYQATRADREAVEVEITSLERELESGVVDEGQRPKLEARHDELQRKLNALRQQESELLAIIQKAQEAVPILKELRQAKQKEIEALRVMRRGLFEKFTNLHTTLDHAMSEVIAQAKTARCLDVDPAFNFTIDAIMKNTIRTAGALMESAIERANKAAVNPEDAARYAAEFRGYIEKYIEGIDKLEEIAAQGGVYGPKDK